MRYPKAEWIPWQGDAYYRGINKPIAVVLHIQQGWQSTYENWARRGHHRASVHYSIRRDGRVIQMLDHEDGGYHAGITAFKARHYEPTWPLWKGPNVNVNHYTIGIEHEGFYDEIFSETGTPFTLEQREASHQLCHWLSDNLNIPYDEDHFPPHAAIDLRDRANDFATPTARKLHYDFLFGPNEKVQPLKQEDDMADEQARAMAEAVQARNETLNDVMVIARDINRAISEPHPALWEIHKLLVDSGHIDDPEYVGDYKGYA